MMTNFRTKAECVAEIERLRDVICNTESVLAEAITWAGLLPQIDAGVPLRVAFHLAAERRSWK